MNASLECVRGEALTSNAFLSCQKGACVCWQLQCECSCKKSYGPFNPQKNVQPGLAGCGPNLSMSSSRICSGSRQVLPSGSMTHAWKLQQIAEFLGSLDATQPRTLQQMLAEKLNAQMRMNPEFFGDVPRDERNRTGFGGSRDATVTLPRVPEHDYEGLFRDIFFAKTEKWVSLAPVPEESKWANRELEIVGFNEYVTQLAIWAVQVVRFHGALLLGCGITGLEEQNKKTMAQHSLSSIPREISSSSAYFTRRGKRKGNKRR